MKVTFKLAMFLLTVCAATDAQVVPEATGPGGPQVSGNLHYAVRYSQTAEFGGGLGDWQTASASADAGYTNSNARLPFSLNYSGGYSWTIAGPSYSTGFFQHLSLSQGVVWRKWNVMASDDVSYLPQAPTTGFSGIPGVGDPIGTPSPSPPSTQSVLTLKTPSVSNTANGELGHSLDSATTLSVGASSGLLRYPDGNGLDTDSLTAHAGLTRRLNARNSLSGQYMYSHSSYPDWGVSFGTNAALFSYNRQWTRRLGTNVGAGPEWIESSDSACASSSTACVPNSTRFSGNAGVNYQMRFGSASLIYSHGINGGAGSLFGAEFDTAGANYSREFDKNLTVGFTGSYMRTAGLDNNGVTNGKYGGIQASRRFGRYMSVFANYTAMDQSSSSTLFTNALSGLTQVIGFGIGYSPQETHLRH
jgi:hypothetical protein